MLALVAHFSGALRQLDGNVLSWALALIGVLLLILSVTVKNDPVKALVLAWIVLP